MMELFPFQYWYNHKQYLFYIVLRNESVTMQAQENIFSWGTFSYSQNLVQTKFWFYHMIARTSQIHHIFEVAT